MSVPGAMRIRKGLIAASIRSQSIVVSADENNFQPSNWFTRDAYLLSLSPTTTDRKITGFVAISDLEPNSFSGHPFGRKRFKFVGPAAATGVLRIPHDDADSVAGNRVQCPRAQTLMLQAGDGFEMIHSGAGVGAEWEVFAVSRSGRLWELLAPQITINQLGYNPTGWAGADVVYVNSDAARTIHGLEEAGGGFTVDEFLAHKIRKRLINNGSFPITFPNESATETSLSSRLRTFSGASLVLTPDDSIDVEYDVAITRWRAG